MSTRFRHSISSIADRIEDHRVETLKIKSLCRTYGPLLVDTAAEKFGTLGAAAKASGLTIAYLSRCRHGGDREISPGAFVRIAATLRHKEQP
jgi:hypothetical protein